MRRAIILVLAMSLLPVTPAMAQSNKQIDGRVNKLEKEMRAVQRKVFSGGNSKYFEPEIAARDKTPVRSATTSSPVSDLIRRVDALENQIARITGRLEQNEFADRKRDDTIKSLSSQLVSIQASIDASKTGPKTAAADVKTSAASSKASDKPASNSSSTPKPSAERVAAVSSIVKTVTEDPAEDSYIYGYRLWEAKFYPEAVAQLKETVAKHGKHRRASFAQNLMGRAYLDDGKPGSAAHAFHKNYQDRPRGTRAPDSLYFLGVALTQLKKPTDACSVFAELAEVYPAEAAGRLSNRVARGRANANCK